MSIVSYPAVFHKENSSYWIEFPDLDGCFSSGESIEDAYTNAQEALGLYLDKEDDTYNRVINKPSTMDRVIEEYQKDLVMLVTFDSLEYARKYKTKAVKKTLSIPEWLNDLAMKENINFSAILQEALIAKLKL